MVDFGCAKIECPSNAANPDTQRLTHAREPLCPVKGENTIASKRILLVEDERELRELLALGLRKAGYIVDVAATAAEAHRLLDAQFYALVVADWQLPDGNGIDVADRAAKLRARTAIVSGYLFGLPAGAAERHGMITKPITTYDLVAAAQHRIGNPN